MRRATIYIAALLIAVIGVHVGINFQNLGKQLSLKLSSFSKLFWVLAQNEFRVCIRLSRTKFVLGLTVFVCVWYFTIVTLSHMQMSGLVPMFGVISPRYLTALLGGSFLALFSLGILVLAFDIQSRDENNHIHEVIASKPVSNMTLFLGRLSGIFIVMGVPLVGITVLAMLYGIIAEIFSIPFGEPTEPWSIASLLVMDVLPNFIFFGLLVVLLASFIRPRFVALVLTAFCLYGLLWVTSRLPLSVSMPLQTVTGNVIFPSELTPTFVTAEVFLNRVALVLMGIGFLYWLSIFYPRNMALGAKQHMQGVYAFGAGIFLIAGMCGVQFLEHQQIVSWTRAHHAHFEPAAFPDVHSIEGIVDIYPGRAVSLDLNMSVSLPDQEVGEEVLFSFNPGYRIDILSIGGRDIEDYQFRHGLLKIPRRYFDAKTVNMTLQARGRPNPQFAYLDTVERTSKIFGPEVRQLRYLGTENYIFRPDYVALMPGVKWYPVAGTATNEDHWDKRLKDFFTVDLQVSVPRKWVVAGPARRHVLPDEKRTTFRFRTSNPIPKLALVAARFERYHQSIDGVEFEVLFSRAHRRNFDALVLTGEALRKSFTDSLDEIKAAGLNYPYSVFSLVEIPASLRVYGGGSRIDSVLGMPGILMMPETTLPTLHLDSFHEEDDFTWAKQQNFTNVQWMEYKLGSLKRYFGIELYAGNYLSQSYRSIVSDQTNVTGPHAQLLNLMLEQVIQLTLLEYEFSFDFDLAFDLDVLDFTYIEPAQIVNLSRRGSDIDLGARRLNIRDTRVHKLTTEEVLDAVESIPLIDYDSNSNLGTINKRALRVRALAVSQLVIDSVGTERLNSIIAALVDRYRGQNFTYDDFIAEAQSHDVNLELLIGAMLYSPRLPGFILSKLTQHRIETDEVEAFPFQVSFTLTNGESVSGYCRLTPINRHVQIQNRDFIDFTIPLYIEKNQSIEVVVESRSPMIDIEIEPYLSLNRATLHQRVTSIPDWYDWYGKRYGSYIGPADIGQPQIVSIRELQMEPSEHGTSIHIDDLDAGFSIVNQSDRFNFQPLIHLARRLAGTSVKEKLRGLPAYQRDDNVVPHDTWERKADTTAHGKYWKTLAMNRGGSGKNFAKFVTSLPTTGKWRLEYFIPAGNFETYRHFIGARSSSNREFPMGVAIVDVYGASTEIKESIDFSAVESGWHMLGEYEIENTDVEVWVSNPDEQDLIFADAIRWTPLDKPN